jgi:hypothetical protein
MTDQNLEQLARQLAPQVQQRLAERHAQPVPDAPEGASRGLISVFAPILAHPAAVETFVRFVLQELQATGVIPGAPTPAAPVPPTGSNIPPKP